MVLAGVRSGILREIPKSSTFRSRGCFSVYLNYGFTFYVNRFLFLRIGLLEDYKPLISV